MQAARSPRADKRQARLVVVNDGDIADSRMEFLPDYLRAGDLLVVNDAATLPASLSASLSGSPAGSDGGEQAVEIRLSSQRRDGVWQAVVLGAGDWRTPTERRPSPPALQAGAELRFADDFRATVRGNSEVSDRLLDLEFNLCGAELWQRLYRYGKPVQYSYMDGELQLWSVQNVYGSRPWAVEMPSAGHAFDWALLLGLLRKGIRVVRLTHGAGLSSTGDGAIDSALPLAERFDIPEATMAAVQETRAAGGRVIAVGTSVVRALESAALGLAGTTDVKLGPAFKLQLVQGILTGTHDASESHYQLLGAFLPEAELLQVSQHLEARDYLTHEFGDLCLIFAARDTNGQIRWRATLRTHYTL